MRGQNVHGQHLVKINLPEFPAGREFAGICPDFGRQRARLLFGRFSRREMAQEGKGPRGQVSDRRSLGTLLGRARTLVRHGGAAPQATIVAETGTRGVAWASRP